MSILPFLFLKGLRSGYFQGTRWDSIRVHLLLITGITESLCPNSFSPMVDFKKLRKTSAPDGSLKDFTLREVFSYTFSSFTRLHMLELVPRLLKEDTTDIRNKAYRTLVLYLFYSLKTSEISTVNREALIQKVLDMEMAGLKGDQPRAYLKIWKWLIDPGGEPFFNLKGYAGTGKTVLLGKLPVLLELAQKMINANWEVAYCAPTHKAKSVLSKSVGQPARTIYSYLKMRMEEGESEDRELVDTLENFSLVTDRNKTPFLVCDEVSMLPARIVEKIKEKAKLFGLKVILVGDPAQLNPVGEEFSEAFLLPGPKVMMKQILRSDNSLVKLSMQVRAGDYDFKKLVDENIALCRNDFKEQILANYDVATGRVIAWRNKTVDVYNQIIREHLGRGEDLEADDIVVLGAPVAADYGDQPIANTGDEFLVSAITPMMASWDAGLRSRLKIGEGLLLPGSDKLKLKPFAIKAVELDELGQDVYIPQDPQGLQQLLSTLADAARSRVIKWSTFWEVKNAFTPLKFGYCLTSHASQGSSFDTTFVDIPDILANSNEREAQSCLYVACTRSRSKIFLKG